MRDLSDEQLVTNLHAFRNDLSPNARYASFDYCYNYFQEFCERGDLASLASDEHIQVSALHLGFYLASWGMYRGSTDLLQRSVRHLLPVIQLIATTSPDSWAIDVDRYDDGKIENLLALSAAIRCTLGGNATDTLVTKIMLGVLGNVPAFDTQFRAGFGTFAVGKKSLQAIGKFADKHQAFLADHKIYTHNFLTGAHTDRLYPKAKLLDMIFFIEGSKAQP